MAVESEKGAVDGSRLAALRNVGETLVKNPQEEQQGQQKLVQGTSQGANSKVLTGYSQDTNEISSGVSVNGANFSGGDEVSFEKSSNEAGPKGEGGDASPAQAKRTVDEYVPDWLFSYVPDWLFSDAANSAAGAEQPGQTGGQTAGAQESESRRPLTLEERLLSIPGLAELVRATNRSDRQMKGATVALAAGSDDQAPSDVTLTLRGRQPIRKQVRIPSFLRATVVGGRFVHVRLASEQDPIRSGFGSLLGGSFAPGEPDFVVVFPTMDTDSGALRWRLRVQSHDGQVSNHLFDGYTLQSALDSLVRYYAEDPTFDRPTLLSIGGHRVWAGGPDANGLVRISWPSGSILYDTGTGQFFLGEGWNGWVLEKVDLVKGQLTIRDLDGSIRILTFGPRASRGGDESAAGSDEPWEDESPAAIRAAAYEGIASLLARLDKLTHPLPPARAPWADFKPFYTEMLPVLHPDKAWKTGRTRDEQETLFKAFNNDAHILYPDQVS